ncbi:hypothetical protein [Lysobacter tyrosinilyticus]
MVNKTMGTNQDRNRTGTPGTPGERREGMGREQEGRQASHSDQSGRQQGQTDRSNQSGSKDRDRSGGGNH